MITFRILEKSMRQIAFSFLTICTLLVAQNPVQRVQDVRTIYVDSFGTGEGADVIRSKVITRLVKAGRFEVLQSPEKADAILTGASSVTKTSHYSATNGENGSASGGTSYHATAGIQLINRDQKILWADDASNRLFAHSASSSLADKIVKDLLKATQQPNKK